MLEKTAFSFSDDSCNDMTLSNHGLLSFRFGDQLRVNREIANSIVSALQQQFDLIDSVKESESIMYEMAEQHENQLNAFTSALIMQIMKANNLEEIRLNTSAVDMILTEESHELTAKATAGAVIYTLNKKGITR